MVLWSYASVRSRAHSRTRTTSRRPAPARESPDAAEPVQTAQQRVPVTVRRERVAENDVRERRVADVRHHDVEVHGATHSRRRRLAGGQRLHDLDGRMELRGRDDARLARVTTRRLRGVGRRATGRRCRTPSSSSYRRRSRGRRPGSGSRPSRSMFTEAVVNAAVPLQSGLSCGPYALNVIDPRVIGGAKMLAMSWIVPPAVALLASWVERLSPVQFAPWRTLKSLVSIELSPFPSTLISLAPLTSWKLAGGRAAAVHVVEVDADLVGKTARAVRQRLQVGVRERRRVARAGLVAPRAPRVAAPLDAARPVLVRPEA